MAKLKAEYSYEERDGRWFFTCECGTSQGPFETKGQAEGAAWLHDYHHRT